MKSTNFENMKNIERNDGFLESVLSKKDSKKIPFFFYLFQKLIWKIYLMKIIKIFFINYIYKI